jgi:hypothetical protein
MKNKVAHEWLVESVDQYGDIHDTNCYPTLADAIRTTAGADHSDGGYYRLGLVRDEGNEVDMLIDRQWAYFQQDGTLPESYNDGAIIPLKRRYESLKFDAKLLASFADRDVVEA